MNLHCVRSSIGVITLIAHYNTHWLALAHSCYHATDPSPLRESYTNNRVPSWLPSFVLVFNIIASFYAPKHRQTHSCQVYSNQPPSGFTWQWVILTGGSHLSLVFFPERRPRVLNRTARTSGTGSRATSPLVVARTWQRRSGIRPSHTLWFVAFFH